MKDIMEILGHIFVVEVFLWAIFFVLFGQITVRRLRKNPATKDHLGLVWNSGGDIPSTAIVLTIPGYFSRNLKRSRFASLVPNPDVLLKHTTLLDRVLARTMIFLLGNYLSILFLFMALDALGINWQAY